MAPRFHSKPKSKPGSGGGGGNSRDWLQIYSIYGIGSGDVQTILFLVFNSFLFAASSIFILHYFAPIFRWLSSRLSPSPIPSHLLRFLLGFSGSFLALSSLCLFFASANVLHSSLLLRHRIAQRIVAPLDWSSVRSALDLGCGRGILLNSLALHLKRSGSRGRVIGLDPSRGNVVSALRRACAEGVQEYVTCKQGDAREVPFGDGCFDVVVSGVHLSGLGRRPEERGRGLGEMVRVLRPGGVGVVWDLVCVPEFVERLREMRMEDIRVSERITAYMVSSQIVSFRKPVVVDCDGGGGHHHHHHQQQPAADWRANIN